MESGYALLDAGAGRKLERFGGVTIDRPAPGATRTSILPRRAWNEADLRFDREWEFRRSLPEPWRFEQGGVVMDLRPSPRGQVGLFPEHVEAVEWMAGCLAAAPRPCRILNSFAYTGFTTLRLASAEGEHEICHLDASRSAVAWARRNAELSGLSHRPVRWMVEDAITFLQREARRKRRYDAVLLDPPAFGRGGGGKSWKLARDLPRLLEACGSILSPNPVFVHLSCHDPALPPLRLLEMMREGLSLPGGIWESGEAFLAVRETGCGLGCGSYARWCGQGRE